MEKIQARDLINHKLSPRPVGGRFTTFHKNVEIDQGERVISVKVMERDRWDRWYHSRVKVHFWGEDYNLVADIKKRLGDNDDWQREARAKAAEEKKVIVEALNVMGIDVTKINYSRKAGCSCGCSPGFIIEATGAGGPSDHIYGVDIYMQLLPDESKTRQAIKEVWGTLEQLELALGGA